MEVWHGEEEEEEEEEEDDGNSGFRAWICNNMEGSYMYPQRIILGKLYLLFNSPKCSCPKMEKENGLNRVKLELKQEKYEFDQPGRGESTH